MPARSLAKQIDAFELEFKYVEALIDILYQLPSNHPYFQKTIDDLHSHRLEMRKSYDDIRSILFERSLS